MKVRKKFKSLSVGDIVSSIIAGILIGVSYILGKNFYASSGYIKLADTELWIKGILTGIFFSCIILCILIIF